MKYLIILAVLLAVIPGPDPAKAGSGAGGIVFSFNTSARYEGMGSAGVGAPWGGATNHWANPAQLAYRRGLQLEWFRSELAAGLADDIVLENQEFILGVGGVTVLWGRTPASGRYLDMGSQTATDENGQPVGTFHSYMKSESYGLAVDVVQVFDYFQSGSEDPLNLSRYGSLSFGYVNKDFEDKLSGDSIIQDPQGASTGQANTHDFGWVVRVTPVNTLDTEDAIGFLLGVAYGSSLLNGGDEVIVHADADQSDPLPRAHVNGWSLHGEIAVGRQNWRKNTSTILDKLYDTFNPFLSLTIAGQTSVPGYVWDRDTGEYIYKKDTSGVQDEIGNGWELGLGNIFYLRRGHVEVIYADIDEDTEGWGINAQVGDMFGFRYDKATVPQASGLPTVDRETWLVWMNPLAFCAD
ncbi:MAG: hypothetical protein ABFS42_09755 [Candidatus Krumholzibacteriota bacterium]